MKSVAVLVVTLFLRAQPEFACAEKVEVASNRVETRVEEPPAPISSPLLRFEEIEIPAAAFVQAMSGEVELVAGGRWTKLLLDSTVGSGSRIRIAPGASLTLRLVGLAPLKFTPAPVERLLVLRLAHED